jgi:hypothetical protein
MPTMESVPNNVHYTLIKGEPSTGKSIASLTYPKPMYWLSFDGKMNGLVGMIRKWNYNPKEIVFDDYTDWTSARNKLEQLQINCPYKTVVLDSVTSCADYMLRQTIKQKVGKQRQSGAQAGKLVGGIAVNELEDYGAEAAGLTEMIALTKDINKFHKADIILIAHVIRTDYKSPDGTMNISRVLVTAGKKPAAKIPAYCDEVYHFGYENSAVVGEAGPRVVSTMNNGEDYARTTLELPSLIKLGNDNLYEKFILPAINKQSVIEVK